MKHINQQIKRSIDERAAQKGITSLEAAREMLSEFLMDNLIYSAGQVNMYIEAAERQ